MKITELSYTRNKKRINIGIDNKFAFAVEENTYLKFNLSKGQELTAKQVQKIKETDLVELLVRKSLDYLARRPRSRKEIEDYCIRKLELKDQNQDKKIYIEKTLGRLENLDMIDDKKFAELLINEKLRARDKSALEIEQSLIKYGIHNEIYRALLSKLADRKKETEIIKNLILKKQKSLSQREMTKEEKKKKIVQYLLRKGFSWETIKTKI